MARPRRNPNPAQRSVVPAIGGSETPEAVWGQPTNAEALTRGFTVRCPVCGSRDLFPGWVRMRDRCPRCGFWFERVEGHWIGSIGMNTIITFGALLIFTVVGLIATIPDTPLLLFVGISVAIGVLMPPLIFPMTRTLWSAIDLLMTPISSDDFRGAVPPVAEQGASETDPAQPSFGDDS